MVKITLSAEQKASIEPLVRQASLAGGSVFAQARRGMFPEHEQIFVTCHLVPAESHKRLKKFLDQEAARLLKKKEHNSGQAGQPDSKEDAA